MRMTGPLARTFAFEDCLSARHPVGQLVEMRA
jgi:hypothetical protein